MTDTNAEVPAYDWTAAVTKADGTSEDITRELAVLYDAIVGSMDWGSGFLDNEDARAILRVRAICGFDGSNEYALETGYPLLLDADGEALNVGSLGGAGWAELVETTSGKVLRVRGVSVTRDGVVHRIRACRRWAPNAPVVLEFGLNNPREVWASERVEFEEKVPT